MSGASGGGASSDNDLDAEAATALVPALMNMTQLTSLSFAGALCEYSMSHEVVVTLVVCGWCCG